MEPSNLKPLDVAGLPARSGWATPWLGLGSPRELLARILPGDPLELRARCVRQVCQRALLVDLERVELRALARVACFSNGARRGPSREPWIEEQVEQALEEICAELERDGQSAEPALGGLADFAQRLGVPLESARSALAAFHRAALGDRIAFVGLVLEGRSLDELARAQGVNASEIGRRARRALEQMLAALAELRRTSVKSGGPACERAQP